MIPVTKKKHSFNEEQLGSYYLTNFTVIVSTFKGRRSQMETQFPLTMILINHSDAMRTSS